MAKDQGATFAINVKDCKTPEEQVQKLRDAMEDCGMTEGFDVGMEMSGNASAINAMMQTMNNGGKISILGITGKEPTLPWNTIVMSGLTLKGIYGREIYETWYKMVSMLGSGLDVSDVITHEFHIDDFEKGFALMNSGQCGKVILNWD